jgi:transcriptional regulator with XRE-family HTH domain
MVSADLIREARLRAGLTQSELAHRSGRERSVIARWEQGGSAPSLETLLDLLAVCGYDLPLELADRDEDLLTRLRESALLSPERRLERMLVRSRQVGRGDELSPFDPYAIVAALERHRVAYLLIGSLARVLRGTDEVAQELEITPSRQPPNLSRLQRALADLAGVHQDGTDARSIDTAVATNHGSLILVSEPVGYQRGYTDLRRAASRESIGRGLRPFVGSAADLAGMLSAIGRDEDRATIYALRRLIRLGA